MAPSNHSSSPTHSTYDLVLLLDTEADQGARAGVLKDVMQSISSEGELLRHDQWGNRELAYPIRHRHQAEYHLLQFQPSKVELLRGLDRSLSIADEVLRFRIVKLRPGTPEPPDIGAGAPAAGEQRGGTSASPSSAPAAPTSSSEPASPGAAASASGVGSDGEVGDEQTEAEPAVGESESGGGEEGETASEPA
jgi:small subunit ribosomal protein S6